MWRVEVAADVVERDQLGQLALVGRLELAAALAQLRLDVGEAEPLVDARLVGEEVRPSSPLDSSAMPCSETERPRAERRSRSCTLWSAEPVKCCSRLPKVSRARSAGRP